MKGLGLSQRCEKANASDKAPAQEEGYAKRNGEDSKDSDKMTETNSVGRRDCGQSTLALLGVIAFWLIRRKKESEIPIKHGIDQKVRTQLDAEKADKSPCQSPKNLPRNP